MKSTLFIFRYDKVQTQKVDFFLKKKQKKNSPNLGLNIATSFLSRMMIIARGVNFWNIILRNDCQVLKLQNLGKKNN